MSRASDFDPRAAQTEYNAAVRAHHAALDRYERARDQGDEVARARAGRELDQASRHTLNLRDKLKRWGLL